MFLFRYIWASPNSIIGLLFLPSAFVRNGGFQVVEGVLEIHSPFVAWVLKHCTLLPGGAWAITFGHVVLGCHAEALAQTRAHERIHVGQYERWGPVFIPAYLMASMWALVTGAGAYRGNFFEREAEGELRTKAEGPGTREAPALPRGRRHV